MCLQPTAFIRQNQQSDFAVVIWSFKYAYITTSMWCTRSPTGGGGGRSGRTLPLCTVLCVLYTFYTIPSAFILEKKVVGLNLFESCRLCWSRRSRDLAGIDLSGLRKTSTCEGVQCNCLPPKMPYLRKTLPLLTNGGRRQRCGLSHVYSTACRPVLLSKFNKIVYIYIYIYIYRIMNHWLGWRVRVKCHCIQVYIYTSHGDPFRKHIRLIFFKSFIYPGSLQIFIHTEHSGRCLHPGGSHSSR